jgi:hypothetical protein
MDTYLLLVYFLFFRKSITLEKLMNHKYYVIENESFRKTENILRIIKKRSSD